MEAPGGVPFQSEQHLTFEFNVKRVQLAFIPVPNESQVLIGPKLSSSSSDENKTTGQTRKFLT